MRASSRAKRAAGTVAGVMLVLAVTVACTSPYTVSGSPPSTGSSASASAINLTVVAERDKAPSAWRVRHLGSLHAIEGWADRTSVRTGQSFRLFVSTAARGYRVRAFRMGWYRGGLGRLVWTSSRLPGVRQPPAQLLRQTNTVVTRWRPSLTVDTRGWLPGKYLLRLDSEAGAQRFVPLTVRGPSADGKVVLVSAVTTWQAYNAWGGYTLYHGPDGSFASRSRVVSFDRPYYIPSSTRGDGEFLRKELSVVALAEQLDLPLDYMTDVDLHTDAHVLDGARAVVTMGHDEYWSPEMRATLTHARDNGVNVAFFGANSIFRRIRFAPTRNGPARLEINYKVASEDPLYGRNPSHVTANWAAPSHARPESSLTGVSYDCFPARADMRVYSPSSWVFAGTAVKRGTRLDDLVGIESDRVNLSNPTPRPMEVLAHTYLNCGGRPTTSDAVYYTNPSGAGVFAAGTMNWVRAVGNRCWRAGHEESSKIVRRVTANILRAFARGPAGREHPAHDNVGDLF